MNIIDPLRLTWTVPLIPNVQASHDPVQGDPANDDPPPRPGAAAINPFRQRPIQVYAVAQQAA